MLFCESPPESRVAQWKRAGPITQRSVDRNYALLKNLFNFFLLPCQLHFNRAHPKYLSCVPLAQRIARWTSNPKVLGSIPRWDGDIQWFVSVVVITSALHAEGRGFEPHWNYIFTEIYKFFSVVALHTLMTIVHILNYSL